MEEKEMIIRNNRGTKRKRGNQPRESRRSRIITKIIRGSKKLVISRKYQVRAHLMTGPILLLQRLEGFAPVGVVRGGGHRQPVIL